MRTPFEIDDLDLHRKVSSLHAVPAAPAALCAVRFVQRQEDSHGSQIRIFAFDGCGEGRLLSDGQGEDTAPRWSPDGRQIAFLSTRGGGSPQLFVMDAEGGSLRQVGQFSQSVTQLRWMPDGRSLLVTAAVAVDPDLRGRPSDAPAPARSAAAPEVVWRLPYKQDGVGYLLQRQIHLFTVVLDSGRQRQLTHGAFDVLGFDVSPDGLHVAYARNREGRFAHRYDLWTCGIDGQGHRQLSHGHATVMQPMWSPDARRIAFSGAVDEGDAQTRLWLADAATGQVRGLALDLLEVADPESLHWSVDGDGIVLLRAHRGRHAVVAVDVADGGLKVLAAGDRQLGALACLPDRLVYTVDHPSLPNELWTRTPGADEGDERCISSLNPWWSQRTPIEAKPLRFDVPDGEGGIETIEGWLLHAADAQGPMPLLNDMHGGPASYALLDFETNVFWQVLCSRGWAVLALNAVGSASFGTEFCRRLSGHWGELDLPQHLAAIDQLQAQGLCDGRVAVSGKSYGGYLSCWATGHTQRFQAAVVMAPVGNIETHYGTSDGGYYADPLYVDSAPRFNRETARRLSPIQHVEHSRTPTLFLQGKEDERCPKCQSEELFVSLLRAGDTPAEMVLYPNEGHGFLGQGQPACRRDAASRIVDWVQAHVRPAADAPAVDEAGSPLRPQPEPVAPGR